MRDWYHRKAMHLLFWAINRRQRRARERYVHINILFGRTRQ